MHLYAIAIYEQLESGEMKRIKFSQKDKSLFAGNDLEQLEKRTLPHRPDDLEVGGEYYSETSNECHYVQLAQKNILVAISSRGRLTQRERSGLFININHIHSRPEEVKTTFDNILANPISYIGCDLLLRSIINKTNDVKAIMINNIEDVIERGEKLDDLQNKAIKLKENANEFHQDAKDLNPCCKF